MKNSRLKQAMHYQLDYVGISCLYVFGIAIAIAVCFMATSNFGDGISLSATGIGGVGFVYFLVIGIGGIREDLRFFLQHGINRRTTFLSHLFSSLLCSAALGLFCEVFNCIVNFGFGFSFGIHGSAYTIQSFFTSWTAYMAAFFFAWQIGALISLVYYRLSKMQQVVFTVSAIALVIFGGSASIRHFVGLSDDFGNIIRLLVENAISLATISIWVGMLFGMLAAAGNFLLLRRAQVKG